MAELTLLEVTQRFPPEGLLDHFCIVTREIIVWRVNFRNFHTSRAMARDR
jgi:hypothetical protein